MKLLTTAELIQQNKLQPRKIKKFRRFIVILRLSSVYDNKWKRVQEEILKRNKALVLQNQAHPWEVSRSF